MCQASFARAVFCLRSLIGSPKASPVPSPDCPPPRNRSSTLHPFCSLLPFWLGLLVDAECLPRSRSSAARRARRPGTHTLSRRARRLAMNGGGAPGASASRRVQRDARRRGSHQPWVRSSMRLYRWRRRAARRQPLRGWGGRLRERRRRQRQPRTWEAQLAPRQWSHHRTSAAAASATARTSAVAPSRQLPNEPRRWAQ